MGVKGRKFETVNLVAFSVVCDVPHAVFVTLVSGPQTAEERWPHTLRWRRQSSPRCWTQNLQLSLSGAERVK